MYLNNGDLGEEIILTDELVIRKIYFIRDQKVMLDSDLAELYEVETKRLNQQVKRNDDRFPQDFMFQLTEKEWENLRLQNATSSWGGRRTLPYVFTEHGVLMLSSVLNSDRAIAVNIQIVRIFTKLRELVLDQKDLLLELEKMKQKLVGQDDKLELIYDYLMRFIKEKSEPRVETGFKRKA